MYRRVIERGHCVNLQPTLSGLDRPDQLRLADCAVHLQKGALGVDGPTPKFGPAFQQITAQIPGQSAGNAYAGLNDPLRLIFTRLDLAIIT